MNPRRIRILTQREISDALRNRWFVMYAGAFVILCSGLTFFVLGSSDFADVGGFGRTAAGLVNLVLFLTPLMGLTLGAQALAGERERGTLLYLRSQPVSSLDIFVSKYLGLAISTSIAIIIGFSMSTLIVSFGGSSQDAGVFAALTGLTVLLAWVSLSIGYLISSFTRRTASALGIAVVVWLALTLVGDLGLLGTALVVRMSPEALLAATVANPLESYRIAAIGLLRGSLDLLGPAGLALHYGLGEAAAIALLLVMAVWLIAPLPIAYRMMIREDQR